MISTLTRVPVPFVFPRIDAFAAEGVIGERGSAIRDHVSYFFKRAIKLLDRQRRLAMFLAREHLENRFSQQRIYRDPLSFGLGLKSGLLLRCERHWNYEAHKLRYTSSYRHVSMRVWPIRVARGGNLLVR